MLGLAWSDRPVGLDHCRRHCVLCDESEGAWIPPYPRPSYSDNKSQCLCLQRNPVKTDLRRNRSPLKRECSAQYSPSLTSPSLSNSTGITTTWGSASGSRKYIPTALWWSVDGLYRSCTFILIFYQILNSRAHIGHNEVGPRNASRMTDVVLHSSAPATMRFATELSSTIGSLSEGETDKRREVMAV